MRNKADVDSPHEQVELGLHRRMKLHQPLGVALLATVVTVSVRCEEVRRGLVSQDKESC